MASIKDDRGYNQGFSLAKSTEVRMQRRAEKILSEMAPSEDASILEIGCGTGEMANWIAEKVPARVLGVDLCAPFIEQARKNFHRKNLDYAALDFRKPGQFAGRKFDCIIGNGILHHLYFDLDNVIADIGRMLNDGGKIIFFEPNYINPYIYFIFTYAWLREKASLEPDEMAFSKDFISKMLARAHFENIVVDYKDFLLPGIPEALIRPSIVIGDVLEKTPLLRSMSQSLFIRAVKKREGDLPLLRDATTT